MIRLAVFLLLSSACFGQYQPNPADPVEAIKGLEKLVEADKTNLGLRDQLVMQYSRALIDPNSGVDRAAARQRILEVLLESIRLDPTREMTGRNSRYAVSWRDPNYKTLRSAWLAAAAKDPANRAVQMAAASALWPTVDHQEILRLVGTPATSKDSYFYVDALAAAYVYGDPTQAATAQTKLSLLADAEQLRVAESTLMRMTHTLREDPLRSTEDLERLELFAADLGRRAGPRPTPPQSGPGSPRRIAVGGNVQSAMLAKKVEPVYPPEAASARISGVVKFSVIIGNDGHVQNLQLLSGHPLLVAAATNALRQWEYKPTLLNGQPVEVVTQVDVNFTLQN